MPKMGQQTPPGESEMLRRTGYQRARSSRPGTAICMSDCAPAMCCSRWVPMSMHMGASAKPRSLSLRTPAFSSQSGTESRHLLMTACGMLDAHMHDCAQRTAS